MIGKLLIPGKEEQEIAKHDSEITLAYLQEVVGGNIEILYLYDGTEKTRDEEDIMIINENGKDVLEYNSSATDRFRASYKTMDYICGPAIITKSKFVK